MWVGVLVELYFEQMVCVMVQLVYLWIVGVELVVQDVQCQWEVIYFCEQGYDEGGEYIEFMLVLMGQWFVEVLGEEDEECGVDGGEELKIVVGVGCLYVSVFCLRCWMFCCLVFVCYGFYVGYGVCCWYCCCVYDFWNFYDCYVFCV